MLRADCAPTLGLSGSRRIAQCKIPLRYAALLAVVLILGRLSGLRADPLDTAEEVDLHVRISWGGSDARKWTGKISVDSGRILDVRPLGMAIDEHATFSWSERAIDVQSRSSRTYDAVDIQWVGPRNAGISIDLRDGQDASRIQLESTIADVVRRPQSVSAEGTAAETSPGNAVLRVERTPGDVLRFSSRRDSLIFSPGEQFDFEIEPNSIGEPMASELQLQVVGPQGSSDANLTNYPLRPGHVVGSYEKIAISIPVPEWEGVHEYAIRLIARKGSRMLRLPSYRDEIVHERRLQIVVVAPTAASTDPTDGRVPDEPLMEIDPSKTRWIPRLGRSHWGSGDLSTRDHSLLGTMSTLNPRSDGGVAWEAFRLESRPTGEPHIVEIEIPSDAVQTLGATVVEMSDASSVMPNGLDGGVFRWPEIFTAPAKMERHRIVYWPRTKNPILVLTNRHASQPAVFGTIRVLASRERRFFESRQVSRLPALLPSIPAGGRIVAAYVDRPLLPEAFSAPADGPTGSQYKDWQTFWIAATRSIEYFRYAGYNAMVLTVAADGGAIYPSDVLRPTPRYDTGVFFADARDPLRKDVLELLMRLCDREGIRLIPAVRLSGPVPGLESAKRQSGNSETGIGWTDSQGRPVALSSSPYNMLNPRVRQEMSSVIQELCARYGRHPSFGGIAVQVSTDCSNVLPGPEYGFDDATCAAFSESRGLTWEKENEDWRTERSQTLLGEKRAEWIQWRADQVTDWYKKTLRDVQACRGDGQLYLLTGELLAQPRPRALFRPSVLPKYDLGSILLAHGLDTRKLDGIPGIVIPVPNVVAPRNSLAEAAIDLEIEQVAAVTAPPSGPGMAAGMSYHPPQWYAVPQLVDDSTASPQNSLLARQSPAGAQNRRRLVHAAAQGDVEIWIDGGWMPAFGQEESLWPVLSAYQQLPRGRFEPLASGDEAITARIRRESNATYVYVVNDAPWHTDVAFEILGTESSRMRALGTPHHAAEFSEQGERVIWRQRLEPYDLVAVQASGNVGAVTMLDVRIDQSVKRSLAARIERLVRGVNSMSRVDRELPSLNNHDFEALPTESPIPGWRISSGGEIAAMIDRDHPASGEQCVRLRSDSAKVSLLSEPISPPLSGRLIVQARMRTSDPDKRPPLVIRLAEEGGAGYVAATERHGLESSWDREWKSIRITGLDPPPGPNRRYRLQFELQGEGEVWIDDIRLYEPRIEGSEFSELLVGINAANVQLQKGQVGFCYRFLEGFWPVYLDQTAPPVTQVAAEPPREPVRKEAESASTRNLWNPLNWRLPRF